MEVPPKPILLEITDSLRSLTHTVALLNDRVGKLSEDVENTKQIIHRVDEKVQEHTSLEATTDDVHFLEFVVETVLDHELTKVSKSHVAQFFKQLADRYLQIMESVETREVVMNTLYNAVAAGNKTEFSKEFESKFGNQFSCSTHIRYGYLEVVRNVFWISMSRFLHFDVKAAGTPTSSLESYKIQNSDFSLIRHVARVMSQQFMDKYFQYSQGTVRYTPIDYSKFKFNVFAESTLEHFLSQVCNNNYNSVKTASASMKADSGENIAKKKDRNVSSEPTPVQSSPPTNAGPALETSGVGALDHFDEEHRAVHSPVKRRSSYGGSDKLLSSSSSAMASAKESSADFRMTSSSSSSTHK